jgi:2-dehydropantoate 2-reductase
MIEGKTMRCESILITGTGALACYFAARLAPYAQVTLLGTWPQGIAALNENGVCLVTADGGECNYKVRATDDPTDCQGHTCALVLVKSWQTERAARQLAACLPDDGVALTLQNGLGNREILAEVLGESRTALGVTTTGATLLGPGHVREGGKGPILIAEQPRLTPFIEVLTESGFNVEMADDLEGVIWGKLIVNVAINPLTAILGVPNGVLLERPHARQLMQSIAEEADAVARALGVVLSYDDPVAEVERVAHRTAQNRSSMLQDVARGAPTEIEAINGAIVRSARGANVDVPKIETLWHLIRAMDSDKLGDMG